MKFSLHPVDIRSSQLDNTKWQNTSRKSLERSQQKLLKKHPIVFNCGIDIQSKDELLFQTTEGGKEDKRHIAFDKLWPFLITYDYNAPGRR